MKTNLEEYNRIATAQYYSKSQELKKMNRREQVGKALDINPLFAEAYAL
ncbi:unnamed protein product [Paramecium sonneborni]|uniref:Uncharacterized protein n=1 Tax=Paramecium sonneborni TaxID=65129 RepID=A0A8S1RFN3_9CILI|nr:unnamed protein product [Paramecium sonneborni]